MTYTTNNPDAFQALVGELQAGDSATGTAVFTFPAGFDASAGTVSWALLNQDGATLSSGDAFDYAIYNTVDSVRIESHAIVNVPSDAIQTLNGQSYQIRWTLLIGSQSFYSFEQLRVVAPYSVPQGVQDAVELAFDPLNLNYVTPTKYDNVAVTIYSQNDTAMPQVIVPNPQQTADGWYYSTTQNPNPPLSAALESYTVVWSGWNLATPSNISRQTGRLFVVNPSILSALADMRVLIDKMSASIDGLSEIDFTDPLLLAYLRRGRDMFNGAYGVPTNFTMLNATGPVREYWLRFSEIVALRAQFLMEGERVFNFSGQSVSLDVDRTQYFQGLADSLQAVMDNECKAFKTILVKRGLLGGDGNVDPTQQAYGAAGSLGITISPATNWGRYSAKFGLIK
jgi:hypothetical protein